MARIAIVTTSYPSFPGDPSGHFVELEAESRAAGGDVVVVLAPGRRESRIAGVLVESLPGEACFGWPGALARLRERPYRAVSAAAFVAAASRRLEELGAFDEIVAHWLVPSGFPIGCAGSGALEVVVHGSDARLVESLPRAARRAVVGRLLERRARFRFVSRALRDELVRATGHEVLRASVVAPCPVDVRGAPLRSHARRRFGIADDETVAVIVARLIEDKRPLVAVNLALARGADRVVVVGDGPLRRDVERADRRVAVAGFQPHDVALAWIAAADFVVSASRREGSPTVVREARALGVRVSAVPAGDVAEWAANDDGIEIVSENDRASAATTAAAPITL